MPGPRRTRIRWRLLAVAWSGLASASMAEEAAPERVPLPPRTRPASGPAATEGGSGWWLGSAGIAAALAVFGGVSLASRRFLPSADSGPIRVVGRSAISPKHSACLLRVGDRVLIVGIGPQGPPSTLGEITDPAELARLLPRRPASPPSAGFDRRIGDDE